MFNAGFTLKSPSVVPLGDFLLPVCLDTDELLLLMQYATRGSLAEGGGRQNSTLAKLWQAMAHINDVAATDCYQSKISDKDKQKIIQYIEAESESEKDMACLEIVTIDGIPYLQQKCGCDETRYYQLSAAAVIGGVPLPAVSSGGDAITNPISVSDDKFGCFANKSSDYMLDRVRDYALSVIDTASLGVDSITAIDEMVDAANIITDILFGQNDVLDIQDMSKNAVTTAFNSDAVRDAASDAWTFDAGNVTKKQLGQWIKSFPNIANNVPVRAVSESWLTYSLIPFYQRKLNQFAAECESDNALPPSASQPIEISSQYWLTESFRNEFAGTIAWGTPPNHWVTDATTWSDAIVGVYMDIAAINVPTGTTLRLWRGGGIVPATTGIPSSEPIVVPAGTSGASFKLFCGGLGSESLWSNGTYTHVETIEQNRLTDANASFIIRAEPDLGAQGGLFSYDASIRFLIDASIMAPPNV